MEIYFPEYYHKFRCIAAACPDSCCKEWTVDVDPQTTQTYRSLPGDLGDRLRQVLQDTDDGTIMVIQDGRCPMWRSDGLCRIQAELGHDALCETCRNFPRLKHNYGSFMELGLELSCPEAARLILASPGYRLCVKNLPGGEALDYDPEIMEILRKSREEILSFLGNTTYPLPQTLAVILLHGHAVQAQIDGASPVPFAPEDCLSQAKTYAKSGNLSEIFHFLCKLEILTDRWQQLLHGAPKGIVWSTPLWGLARYMIQRYWLQAVSDYDLICRVKLVITSCITVGALGGDPVQIAQLFSKEIENNPNNIEAILDGAYTASAFTDTNLLSLLLS